MTLFHSTRSRRRALAADQLETALRAGEAAHPATDTLVRTARSLEGKAMMGEQKRAEMRDRMLRAAEIAQKDAHPGATGPQDAAEPEVHSARVTLPDGSATLADMDRIDPARAAEVVRAVLADQAARDGSR